MRIAIYCHSVAPSIDGVCRRFAGILDEFTKQNHEIILFTLEEEPEALPDNLVAVISLNWMIAPAYPGKKIAKTCLSSLVKIYNSLRKHRPDIIHVTSDGFSHSFALVGLILKIPVVGSFHTDILDLITIHNAHWVQKFLIMSKEHMDSFVLDSCATTSKSFARKLASQHLLCEHIIITAVDGNRFNPEKKKQKKRDELTFGDSNAFLCVYVGRISKEKRLDVIVEAVKTLDNVYLAIIGNGPTAPEYMELHGKKNRIFCKPQFLSHEELAEIYASCDVHVSASEFETLGNTVLEAFSCGIPVVVPKTQGFLDTVTHEENGYLFEPGNVAEARSFVARLKNDRDLCLRMGACGRRSVADKTVETVIEDLLSWYYEGKRKRKDRSFARCLFVILNLSWAVPLTILSLGVYEILMDILALFGIKVETGRIKVVKDFKDPKHNAVKQDKKKSRY